MKVTKYFGPPGTGKTTTLAKVVRDELAGGVDVRRIAYLTFSRAATQVIQERLEINNDEAPWFRTIHGACCKAMGLSEAKVTNQDYRGFHNETGLFLSASDPLDTGRSIGLNKLKFVYDLALAQRKPLDEVIASMPFDPDVTLDNVNYVNNQWRDYKLRVRRFDYTDFLLEYLEDGQSLPIDVAVLDETQDLSELQWQVFWKMARFAKRIYMAGDDDQAIYSFIGASEYGFLDCPADKEVVIEKSYRVPKSIGAMANNIISHVPHRKEKNIQWKDARGTIDHFPGSAQMLPWDDWRAEYKTIMVLARHRAIAKRISSSLTNFNIPHSLHGESPNSWREAPIARNYHKLVSGKSITKRQANAICSVLGLSLVDGQKYYDIKDLGLPVYGDYSIFGGADEASQGKYRLLQQLISENRLDTNTQISVGTMHAAKGREAELVVVVPDCNKTVYDNIHEPREIRLAYVAVTRAIRGLALLTPNSKRYMPHFMEAL